MCLLFLTLVIHKIAFLDILFLTSIPNFTILKMQPQTIDGDVIPLTGEILMVNVG